MTFGQAAALLAVHFAILVVVSYWHHKISYMAARKAINDELREWLEEMKGGCFGPELQRWHDKYFGNEE